MLTSNFSQSEAGNLWPYLRQTVQTFYGSAEFDDYNYPRNSIIYNEGMHPTGLFIVKKGQVKLLKTGNDGKEQIIRIASPGDFLGYMELIANGSYTTSAIALGEVILNAIPREDFFELYRDNCELRDKMAMQLCSDIMAAESKIVSIAYMPVTGRLAEALLEMAEDSTAINITREDLANLIGTAKETVIRLLSQFRKANLVSIQGREIKVLSRMALQNISKQYH